MGRRAAQRGGQRRHIDFHPGDVLPQVRYTVAVALHQRLHRCLRGAEIVDPLQPYDRPHARQADDIAVQAADGGRPAGDCIGRRVRRRPYHPIAAYTLVHHAEPVAIGRMQAAGEHVRPAVVAVDGRGRPVGDRIAKRNDRFRPWGAGHHHRVEEKPRRRGIGKRSLGFFVGMRGAGRRQIGGLQALRVPGHRPARAGNVEADRQFAANEHGIGRVLDEGQNNRIAQHRSTGGHGHGGSPVETYEAIAIGQQRRPGSLQPQTGVGERHGLGAENVRQTKSGFLAPDIRPNDHPETLIGRALLGIRKDELQLRLRGGVAGGVRALNGACPTDDPVPVVRGHGLSTSDERQAHYEQCQNGPRHRTLQFVSTDSCIP